MDHHSSYASSGTRGSNSGEDETNMDLSLRLGLPFQNQNENHVTPIVPDSNPLPNFDFINPYATHQQLASGSRMIHGGGQTSINAIEMMNMPNPNSINYGMGDMANNIGYAMSNMNLNASSVPWPSQQMENHNNYYMSSIGSVVGVPMVPQTPYANNFNYGHQAINAASSGSSSSSPSSTRRRESRLQRFGTYIDINKTCKICSTNDTPMWRKGPLGPKTLCNACGIKYRKEAERKRAREAENNPDA
ncbi:GATA transcription factor 29 [Euphorbia peplus]|nr:GATA transcription factor 29 [Euphorbia peplus]